jgi:hypothetical protein
MTNEALDVIKDVVGWLSAPLLGLVAWAWNQNEKEHERLRAANKELADKAAAIRQHTSDGYSVLNDRVMDHIDAQVKEVRMFVIAEDTKLMAEMGVQRGHIAKIFDKIEAQSQRSEDRHLETLSEIRHLANTMHQALATKADK